MKQLIEETGAKNKLVENKLKVFGLDNIKIDANYIEESSQCLKFVQEIEYSDLKSNVSSMEKNIKILTKEIDQYKNLISSLKECLSGRVNVSEMKQKAVKQQMSIQEEKNRQTNNDNTIQNIIQKLKELEQ